MTKEASLQDRVLRYLRSLKPDVWAVKYHGAMYGTAGVPDILACVRGRFVAIELKTTTKETPIQRMQRQSIEQAGGVSFVAYSLDEVKAVIEPLLYERGKRSIG
jgi:Holliday junction resolvase